MDTTYISLQYFFSLFLVLQGVDREVRDTDCSWGRQGDQQYQASFSFLQLQLQLVSLFFTQGRQVNLAPRNKRFESAFGFLCKIKQEQQELTCTQLCEKINQLKFLPCL